MKANRWQIVVAAIGAVGVILAVAFAVVHLVR
jgi:hypothetical protein